MIEKNKEEIEGLNRLIDSLNEKTKQIDPLKQESDTPESPESLPEE